MTMKSSLDTALTYHEATKHRFEGYARGPGRMDWATQPDPFRHYRGTRRIGLERREPGLRPSYAEVFSPGGGIPPSPVNRESVSQLLFYSMSLSAWKSAGGTTWPLRINPSSGNLHPTECYLVCGPVEGLADTAMVCHYTPDAHALEVRAEIPAALWDRLAGELPQGALLLALASIHWRESWKYGERAYRYCQLDAGHALAALGLAASALGWEAALLDRVGSESIAGLIGVGVQTGPEAEEPDCLLAVFPATGRPWAPGPGLESLPDFGVLSWSGEPNRLSPSHHPWDIIDRVARACRRPPGPTAHPPFRGEGDAPTLPVHNGSFRGLIRQRRSAVAMDGITTMSRDAFFALLERLTPRPGGPPFSLLPWPPQVDLALFVHRVDGLEPGLYFLNRDSRRLPELKEATEPEFLWLRPEACPGGVGLFLLAAGDAREASMQVSCLQDIASDGCFSLAMLAEFAGPLEANGPWFYPRLFWECGMIGQVLYLEAEAAGLRGTGIGCFFDDPLHGLLGLEGIAYQDLYHFTVGGAVEDRRITTLPPYPGRE